MKMFLKAVTNHFTRFARNLEKTAVTNTKKIIWKQENLNWTENMYYFLIF